MFAGCKELSLLLKCVKCPNLQSGIKLSNIETIRELLSIKDEIYVAQYQPWKPEHYFMLCIN